MLPPGWDALGKSSFASDAFEAVLDGREDYKPARILENLLFGTPDQVIERMAKIRDLGCDYAICYFPEAAYDRSGIELFEREVIPALS